MAPKKWTLDGFLGYRLLPHITFYFFGSGHWIGAVPGPTPTFVKIARATGGLTSWAILIYVASASVNGILHGTGLSDISMNLIFVTTAMSALHKYSIFTEQEQGLSRLGEWVNSVETFPRTASDRILKKTLYGFYFATVMAPMILSVKTIISGEMYHLRFPYITNVAFKKFLIVFSTNAMAYEILVDASILMNSLFIYRSELMRIASQLKMLRAHSHDPERFRDDLKACVQQHVNLLKVFKDLRRYHNSMFGYQVFQVEFTTCALIYGMAKGALMGRALVQVLPISTASILEFGLLCWTGEEIRFYFHQLFRNIYKINWYELPVRDQKSITIILEFCKQPVALTGFSVFTATLGTFVEAMKQSFSLYTLLKAVV